MAPPSRLPRRAVITAALAVAVTIPLAGATGPAAAGPPGGADFTLTILHNNDGESKLLGAPGQPDFGGIARFVTLVDELRKSAVVGVPGAGQSGSADGTAGQADHAEGDHPAEEPRHEEAERVEAGHRAIGVDEDLTGPLETLLLALDGGG